MSDERQIDSPADSPLSTLDADRVALAGRARMPSWLAPALGVVMSAWVATSYTARSGGAGSWYFLFLVAVALVVVAVRSTGVRVRTLGARAWFGYLGLIAVGLLLYSVALALYSVDLRWWVTVPAALAFGATVVMVRSIDHSARRSLRHVR
jgi:uncharacterized membrane protein YoaT (DUF817 family)